jgi:glycerol-3-phosphate dehydrogenase
MSTSLWRSDVLRKIGEAVEWDVVVVGGGATGLGTAVEAASRGYRTLLLEAQDFAKSTSSRSTKLVHGGVRYLQQGNIKLVLEALRERGRMLHNAPHLAHRRGFVIPVYAFWEFPFYGVGLKIYDGLAGKESLGRSRILSRKETLEALPTVRQQGLQGGVLYYDGQFDDARYAISLLRTLFNLGGTALNYATVTSLLKRNGAVCGVVAGDDETGTRFECPAKLVVNATGIFSDDLRRMDEPETSKILAVSQGTHLVLPRAFLPGDSALMVPRTSDGRVLFAIPWHERIVVGTTDDPVPNPEYEPRALPDERRFLLEHVERFLGKRPEPSDILSLWSGQRPLVSKTNSSNTAAISRDHTILISSSKLLTVTGGKWTTYRRMGQDVIDRGAPLAGLPATESKTAGLRLHASPSSSSAPSNEWKQVYGGDLPLLNKLMDENAELARPLHDRLPFQRAEVAWAVRYEMARRVEDVLARRTRALFLDARASMEAAPVVARIMAAELGNDVAWELRQATEFSAIAKQYQWNE